MKKKDFILISIVLLISALLLLFYNFIGKQDSDRVLVTIDGKEYLTLSLTEEIQLTIDAGNGKTNVLVIENKTADITDASCPDKLCVSHKSISKNGETIVCLPNKVVVQIIKSGEKGLDGIAGSIFWR